MEKPKEEFYLRYYVGHKGKFGHEFLEWEVHSDGKVSLCFHGCHTCYTCVATVRESFAITATGPSFPNLTNFAPRSTRPPSQLRYANNSKYKHDSIIRKEATVSPQVLKELKRIVEASEILKGDDQAWPEPDHIGRQELEVVVGKEHISFATTKLGSLLEVNNSADPEGLRTFYYLVQDLKCFIFSLIQLHFRVKPI